MYHKKREKHHQLSCRTMLSYWIASWFQKCWMWEKDWHHRNHEKWYILLIYFVSFLFSTQEWQLHGGRVSACFVHCWVVGQCPAHSRSLAILLNIEWFLFTPKKVHDLELPEHCPNKLCEYPSWDGAWQERALVGKQPSEECSDSRDSLCQCSSQHMVNTEQICIHWSRDWIVWDVVLNPKLKSNVEPRAYLWRKSLLQCGWCPLELWGHPGFMPPCPGDWTQWERGVDKGT